MTEPDQEMLRQLREEMLAVQERRHAYSLRKLSFAIALFGVGSVSIANVDFAPLLYFVPLIALVFDVYILVEDHRIKRIGEFIRLEESGSSTEAQKWQRWVRSHPNRLAPFAAPLVTGVMLLAAAMLLWSRKANLVVVGTWFFAIAGVEAVLIRYSKSTRNRFSLENIRDKADKSET